MSSEEKRAAFDDPDVLERFAELVVKTAANLQPGQLLAIGSESGQGAVRPAAARVGALAAEIGKEPVTRAVPAAGYGHGAKSVAVSSFDPHVKRARLQYAADETL